MVSKENLMSKVVLGSFVKKDFPILLMSRIRTNMSVKMYESER